MDLQPSGWSRATTNTFTLLNIDDEKDEIFMYDNTSPMYMSLTPNTGIYNSGTKIYCGLRIRLSHLMRIQSNTSSMTNFTDAVDSVLLPVHSTTTLNMLTAMGYSNGLYLISYPRKIGNGKYLLGRSHYINSSSYYEAAWVLDFKRVRPVVIGTVSNSAVTNIVYDACFLDGLAYQDITSTTAWPHYGYIIAFNGDRYVVYTSGTNTYNLYRLTGSTYTMVISGLDTSFGSAYSRAYRQWEDLYRGLGYFSGTAIYEGGLGGDAVVDAADDIELIYD